MSESRKMSENAFIGNPDYSVLLLEGKTISISRWPVPCQERRRLYLHKVCLSAQAGCL